MRLAGAAREPHEELEGEPAYTDGLHQEEGVVENAVRRRHVLRHILCLGVVLVKVFLKRRRHRRNHINDI